jgi:hypothetical protein
LKDDNEGGKGREGGGEGEGAPVLQAVAEFRLEF